SRSHWPFTERWSQCCESSTSNRRCSRLAVTGAAIFLHSKTTVRSQYKGSSGMTQKIQSAPIWKAAMTVLICACALGGCSSGAKWQAGAIEEGAIARTEFTERIENFFEYEPLKAGKPSQFRIHLTDLSEGSPVEKAEVKLTVRMKGGGASAV